jgi:hypothetical protein
MPRSADLHVPTAVVRASPAACATAVPPVVSTAAVTTTVARILLITISPEIRGWKFHPI